MPQLDPHRLYGHNAAVATRVGFLGGTGIEGRGLALRFALAGASVVVGSRSEERARAAAAEYNALIGGDRIRGAVNPDMLRESDIVFITLPYEHAAEAVSNAASDLRPGVILVDVTVPMRFRDGRAEFTEPPEGSNAERIADRIPKDALLVGAFKTIPAHVLAEIDTPLDCDDLVCGDSNEAKQAVIAACGDIPTLRSLDAGPLSAARILERMTVLAVHLNRRYKRKGARYRVQGV
jgi:NADPH-dependent F420 reductase